MTRAAGTEALLEEAERLEVEAAARSWAPYPEYRATGLHWLEQVPAHWRLQKLKHAARIQFSNVDKKSEDGEQPVCLCNYVDVYYHDRITSDIEFMEATALPREVAKFQLMLGDVLVTKDSEDPHDICVPAVVAEDLPGVLCGYHLAQIRPIPGDAYGPYLSYALASSGIRDQFRMRANGITRFGLSQDDICSSLVCLPPLPEQQTIAAFLDRKTRQIDELIEKKRRLIDLLQEKRTALISHAVTKGLNPDAPMKPSGIDWLGDVPEHWNIERLKALFTNLNHRRVPISAEIRGGMSKAYPYYGASGIIDYVEDYIFDEPLLLVAEDGANLLSRSTPLAFVASGQYWVNNHAHILRPRVGPLSFWESLLQLAPLEPLVTGSAQPKLTKENLGTLPLPVPPLDEQQQIGQAIDSIRKRYDGVIGAVGQGLEQVKEYRQSLISDAVTGKIDVREEVPS
ncbi:MAG: restriction endonuclease subunit S [Phycisphaerales bacterium]|nr:restriction endonuclease subunit S [Phycisphaerales bacterium]